MLDDSVSVCPEDCFYEGTEAGTAVQTRNAIYRYGCCPVIVIVISSAETEGGLASPLAAAQGVSWPGPVAGLAWMSMDVSGLLKYRLMLTNMASSDQVTSMQV